MPNSLSADKVLLKYFYRSIDSVNKCVDDQLYPGSLIQQPYVILAQLLYVMTIINRVWYTLEDHASPFTFKLTKEHTEKDLKIMTQLYILSKNVMGAGAQSINFVGVECSNIDEAKFEALCKEEVYFLPN